MMMMNIHYISFHLHEPRESIFFLILIFDSVCKHRTFDGLQYFENHNMFVQVKNDPCMYITTLNNELATLQNILQKNFHSFICSFALFENMNAHYKPLLDQINELENSRRLQECKLIEERTRHAKTLKDLEECKW